MRNGTKIGYLVIAGIRSVFLRYTFSLIMLLYSSVIVLSIDLVHVDTKMDRKDKLPVINEVRNGPPSLW